MADGQEVLWPLFILFWMFAPGALWVAARRIGSTFIFDAYFFAEAFIFSTVITAILSYYMIQYLGLSPVSTGQIIVALVGIGLVGVSFISTQANVDSVFSKGWILALLFALPVLQVLDPNTGILKGHGLFHLGIIGVLSSQGAEASPPWLADVTFGFYNALHHSYAVAVEAGSVPLWLTEVLARIASYVAFMLMAIRIAGRFISPKFAVGIGIFIALGLNSAGPITAVVKGISNDYPLSQVEFYNWVAELLSLNTHGYIFITSTITEFVTSSGFSHVLPIWLLLLLRVIPKKSSTCPNITYDWSRCADLAILSGGALLIHPITGLAVFCALAPARLFGRLPEYVTQRGRRALFFDVTGLLAGGLLAVPSVFAAALATSGAEMTFGTNSLNASFVIESLGLGIFLVPFWGRGKERGSQRVLIVLVGILVIGTLFTNFQYNQFKFAFLAALPAMLLGVIVMRRFILGERLPFKSFVVLAVLWVAIPNIAMATHWGLAKHYWSNQINPVSLETDKLHLIISKAPDLTEAYRWIDANSPPNTAIIENHRTCEDALSGVFARRSLYVANSCHYLLNGYEEAAIRQNLVRPIFDPKQEKFTDLDILRLAERRSAPIYLIVSEVQMGDLFETRKHTLDQLKCAFNVFNRPKSAVYELNCSRRNSES